MLWRRTQIGAGDFLKQWTLPRSKTGKVEVEVHPAMAQSSCFWGGVKMDPGNTAPTLSSTATQVQVRTGKGIKI